MLLKKHWKINYAKDAPVQLKQQVFDRIASAGSDSKAEDVEEETTPVRTMGAWKWIAAAAIVMMAVAAYWAFDVTNKNRSLQAENNELQEKVDRANEDLARLQSGSGGGPAKSDFMMAAIRGDNQASATIYWDTLSKDVYLMVNNMPQPASDKQYQLWALLPQEGAAPIDLGMIEVKQQRLLYRMKNVQNAKAFAITLEPKGGSKSPTSTPMVSSAPVSL
jgi:anti-sigma-K factor RskA